MGSRNVLTLLIVVFVAVLLYNALYFTGVVGGFGQSGAPEPLPQGSQFDVPGLNRPPQPTAAPRPTASTAAAVAARGTVPAAELVLTADWGRNPFFTPAELWALANYRPVRTTEPVIPPGGLVLQGIVMDSTGRRVAMINDQIVTIGDRIGGMRVVDVWDDAVVFRLAEGERHVLRMADAAIDLSVSGGVGRY